jgi:hypothetical protein
MRWPHCGRVSTFTSRHVSATHGAHFTKLEHTHKSRFQFPVISNNKTPVARNFKAKLCWGTEILHIKKYPPKKCLSCLKENFSRAWNNKMSGLCKVFQLRLWRRESKNACNWVCAAGVRLLWQPYLYSWSQVMCKSENLQLSFNTNLR